MARTGRPPLSDEQIQERIAAYCARYGVKARNDEGFPVFPAGRRETEQHRQWITLYKVFARARRRTGAANPPDAAAACPICLRSGTAAAHRRCTAAIALVRDLGPDSLARLRSAAFEGTTPGPRRRP